MYFHKDLTKEKWFGMDFFSQMANIGAEVGRTINWQKKDANLSQASLFRAIELLDLTIEDKKNKTKLKELCRLREIIADYFCFDNIYKSTAENLNNYFYNFNYATQNK